MRQLVARLRRALAKLDEFLGGPLHWLDAFRPHCYCMACKYCTYHAEFRLYTARYNSCEACLGCFSRNTEHGGKVLPFFKMSHTYRLRCMLGNLVGYLGAKIYPSDPKDVTRAPETVFAGGKK